MDTNSPARLINLSTRGEAGTGANIMIAGFYISGSGAADVMIRGVGPELTRFNVSGVLADPKLELFDVGALTPKETNDDWGTSADVTAIQAFRVQVSAFGLASGGKDSVLFGALPVGGGTAQISPASGSPGIALAEIYVAP
jgi:hypothetical protein